MKLKKHFIVEHPEEMLEVFKGMTGGHHYCPFHRGSRHAVFVTCNQPKCPECGKNLENFRRSFAAGFLAKMAI
jgi:hypothetical protein